MSGGSRRFLPVTAIIAEIYTWAKEHELVLDHDLAGYEFNVHFTQDSDMTMFLLSKYGRHFKITE